MRHGFDPWIGKIPWRRAWQPTPAFLPGESLWTEEPGGLQSIGLQSQTQLKQASTHTVRKILDKWSLQLYMHKFVVIVATLVSESWACM